MFQLLTKQHQRQLKLVKYLYTKKNFTHYQEISSVLGCSNRILYQDIQYLKNIKFIKIYSNNSGLYVDFPINFSIDTLYNHFLKQSVAYKLIVYLFLEDYGIKKDLCNLLYISNTGLLNTITTINNFIAKRYNIEIDKKTLQFLGNEKDIRLFFITVLYENRPFRNWEFSEIISQEDIHKFITNFANKFVFKIDKKMLNCNFLSIYLLVNTIRYQNNHIVQIDFPTTECFNNLRKNNVIEKFDTFFSNFFDIQFNIESFSQIFYYYCSDSLIRDEIQNQLQHSPTLYTTKSYLFLKQELTKLSYELDLYLPNSYSLIKAIHNNTFCFPYNPTLKTDRLEHDFIKENTALIYIKINKIYDFIESYLEYLNIEKNTELKRHLCYLIISYWEAFFIQQLPSKITIGCLSSYDNMHSQMIIDYLKIFLDPNKIEFTILDSYAKQHENIDIIITNFSYPSDLLLENQFAIHIENFPTKEDINKIFLQTIECFNFHSRNTTYTDISQQLY